MILKIKNRDKGQREAEIDLQQRELWAILIQCPFCVGALPNCPLNQYREGLNLEDKFQFCLDHPGATVKSILKIHEQCFAKRQEDWLKEIPDHSAAFPLPAKGG